MRILPTLAALLALSAAACVNDSKNSDTAARGPAGRNGDTAAATANTSGTGNQQQPPGTDTTAKAKGGTATPNSH